MRQKGCSFVTLRPLRNRGLILFREVNESKWTPEASALSRCNFLRFCRPNPADLTSKNVDASEAQKRSFTSRKSIRPRYIGGVRERQPECSLLALLCREHEPNPRRFRTRAPRHLAREIVIAVLEQAAGSLRGEHAGWSSLWRNTMSLIIWSGGISRHATNAMMSAIAAILPFVSISKSKVNGFTRSERPILDP